MHPPTRLYSRTRWTILPVVLASLLPCAFGTAASPSNDNLASAQVIAPDPSFSVAGSDVGATRETFEMAPGYPVTVTSTVWYAWTAPVSGHLQLTIKRTDGNTCDMGVFEGPTPDKGSFLGQNSFGANTISLIAVEAGQAYFFSIGNTTSPGTFTLAGAVTDISTPAPTPTATPTPAALPSVALVVKTPKVSRSSGAIGKVYFELSSAATADLTVTYKTGGTAVNGTDYKMLRGSVVVPVGATKATLKIKPLPGSTDTLGLKLTVIAGDGYTVGSSAKGKIKIVD